MTDSGSVQRLTRERDEARRAVRDLRGQIAAVVVCAPQWGLDRTREELRRLLSDGLAEERAGAEAPPFQENAPSRSHPSRGVPPEREGEERPC